MLSIAELWLPILLSAVFVFIVSSIIHMFLPIHKGDYSKLPGEEHILETMRAQSVAPGSYMFPCPSSMKDMCSPEMVEKRQRGPVGFLTVVPSGPSGMGKNLAQWFAFALLVGFLTALAAKTSLRAGADYHGVFHITAIAALLGYGVRPIPDSIWKGVEWIITLKFIFDGVVYALVTAATFAWLWPAAS